jgi:hypothetical protein
VAFGYSRMTLHQLRKRFAAQGLVGLLPHPKGPQRNHKLTREVMAFVRQTLDTEPALRVADLPRRVRQQFGLTVHLRSIERALAREQKKDGPTIVRPNQRLLVCHVGLSGKPGTKASAVRCWTLVTRLIALPQIEPSSSIRGWLPG